MFNNYIKIAFRNFKKQKGFSFINIVGLGVGIACCVLIFLWIQNQMSYDKFHKMLIPFMAFSLAMAVVLLPLLWQLI